MKHIRLLYIASGMSVTILIIFGILYLKKSSDQVHYIDAVEHTYKVLSAINLCEKTLIEAEAAQRGYLLTGESNFMEVFKVTLPLIDSSIKEIGHIIADTDGQKVYFNQLKKFIAVRVSILKENIKYTHSSTDPLYFENLRKGTYTMDNCRMYMAKMRDVEEARLQVRLNQKDKYQRLNLSYFKSTFITACLICIIAIVIFFRELSIRLTMQQALKTKIQELSDSKKELEEITFVASHDLQEPMRKLGILSTMITKKLSNKVPESDLEVVYRFNKITEQMQGLLTDLVIYTNLLNPNIKMEEINLYDTFKNAYKEVFDNCTVQFKLLNNLPVIHGCPPQIARMLIHLFDNSLKFKSPDRELVITVNYELIKVKESRYFWGEASFKQYHQITIADNGIGFDKQYSDKIFGLFQRLHTQSDYPGKGIGLAIARRVMANHKGEISANAEKRVGAAFTISFPVIKRH
ncbi:MAG: CHASE3 domain-containing protein [Ferruginibacter sp.]